MNGTQPPLGAHLVPGGTCFALYSNHAEAVELCLFDAEDEPEKSRIALVDRGSGIWSGTVEGVGPGQLYGFRVHGPFDPHNGHRFNPAKLLVDPRALAITGEPPLDSAFCGSRTDDESQPDPRDTGLLAPKSIVVDPSFNWQEDRPPATPWAETVIYECHVRGMSVRHPAVPERLRGTFLGLASEPVLDHLSRLGITAVELLPVQQIASEPHVLRNGLHNYFGYSPLGFFAPHAAYATTSRGGQVREFQQMVRALHERGIEVILDMVLNHTAEGDHRGRTLSLRGIDNLTHYRLQPADRRLYKDSTGCGNSIAADHPPVTELLIDCLRYWVEEMHVDGFRFDLAVTLGRTAECFTRHAPFFKAIAKDPVLSRAKLIAEPWDLGPSGYQRGSFPSGWVEWDDRFRDGVRKIWRADASEELPLLRTIARGSGGLRAEANRPESSLHFVTCHDGFTLEDLVSYDRKNNWANGEDNRDGSDHNLSCNWGVEGPTDSPEILRRRKQAKRNLLATTLLSPGVSMILHGDELNRTQGGNNNAYCQDNELTWIDWSLDTEDREFLEFTSALISLHARLAPLRNGSTADQLRWLTANGHRRDGALAPPSDAAGLCLDSGQNVLLLLGNAQRRDRLIRLPRQSWPGAWTRLLSTVEPGCRSLTGASYRLCARSISVLEFEPEGEGSD